MLSSKIMNCNFCIHVCFTCLKLQKFFLHFGSIHALDVNPSLIQHGLHPLLQSIFSHHLLHLSTPHCVLHEWLLPSIPHIHSVSVESIFRSLCMRWCVVKHKKTLAGGILTLKQGNCLVSLQNRYHYILICKYLKYKYYSL